MTAPRCPHCHTELPETASFCGACGRRIEGWSNMPSVTQGGSALPENDQATRQMEPTPSLLRLAKVQREKRDAERKQKQAAAAATVETETETESMMMRAIKQPRAPVMIAMLLVAVGGGVAGFMIVKQHRRAAQAARLDESTPPAPPSAVAVAPPKVTPPPAPPSGDPSSTGTPPAIAPTPIGKLAKPQHAKAHRLTAIEVPIKAKKTKLATGNGLPHKAVATDSRVANAVNTRATSAPAAATTAPTEVRDPYPTVAAPQQQLAMPAAPHEGTESEGAMSDSDQKAEASARIDADGVRFVVKQHLPQVHACYGRAFKDGSPGGRVEIGFAITGAGRAENVRTEVNTTDSAELARCLETRIREWQFPRPVGGDYELIYPFVFAPGS